MVEYKNAEGYPDPTTFYALCAIEKEKNIIAEDKKKDMRLNTHN